MADMKKVAKEIKPEVDLDNAEEFEKSFKYQGMRNLRTLFDENPKLVKSLEKLIKESLL